MTTLYPHVGTVVSVSSDGDTFVPLAGYAGGLQFGMSGGTENLDGYSDGIQRRVKGDRQGSDSTIAVRRVVGDSGQSLVHFLCVEDDGLGWIRASYPGGRTLTAYGIFHSLVQNPVSGDTVQGFSFSFAQQEPET